MLGVSLKTFRPLHVYTFSHVLICIYLSLEHLNKYSSECNRSGGRMVVKVREVECSGEERVVEAVGEWE